MVTKWSIYWADLNPVKGSEQAGIRPVLVISNDIINGVLPVVTILPISSVQEHMRIYSTEVFLSKEVSTLPKSSVVMIHQIRTISKERIGSLCGTISSEITKEAIIEALGQYFDLE